MFCNLFFNVGDFYPSKWPFTFNKIHNFSDLKFIFSNMRFTFSSLRFAFNEMKFIELKTIYVW